MAGTTKRRPNRRAPARRHGEQQCEHCGHVWLPRGELEPTKCPCCYKRHRAAGTIKLPALCVCKRCGYEWAPRSVEKPLRCASRSCMSPYWDREKER